MSNWVGPPPVDTSDLTAACELVIKRGWATGHAETCAQLVREALSQADARIAWLEEEVSRLRQGERR